MLARSIRLALIRRRRRTDALRMGGLGDAVALSRLELHRLAARRFARNPALARAWPAEHVRSLTATGRVAEALDAGRRAGADRRPTLALSLAAFDPELALARYAGSRLSLRAALMDAAGRPEDATALAASDPDPFNRFLEASLRREDPARAALAWGRGMAPYGLTPPRAVDADRPVTVTNARADAGPGRSGALVSVVMPARNAAAYAGAAVGSVLAQTWRNLELLFVDDASDDDTAALALAAAGGDPRFRLMRLATRGGAYRARNAALAEARGKWVAFQDSDEWSHPERLAIQVAQMEQRDLAAVSSRGIRVDAAGRLAARGVWPLPRWAPSTLMIHRETVLARAGLFDAVLSGADNEYWWRLIQLFGPGRVAISNKPLILGASRPDSLTGAADSGFGGKGYNLDRLIYWERWSFWHASNRNDPAALRLDGEGRPFPIPAGLTL